MVFMRGSSYGAGGQDTPGLADDDIYEFIATEVVLVIWGAIPEVFVSIKTAIIELFDEQCVCNNTTFSNKFFIFKT